ncbi:hypothetical protein ABT084_19405 [Streptomyces sp. NPDC002138]|uniref:hypothetical protein n=1 Tax=Streptomyces sp. NPDC002138 TaxID=3154410 RepID=UPI0033298C29
MKRVRLLPVERPSHARWAPALSFAALIAAAALLAQYATLHPRNVPGEVALQLAGGREAACRILRGQSLWCPAHGDRLQAQYTALRLDTAFFIPGYTLALLGVFGLGSCFLFRQMSRRYAVRALAATLVMAVADLGENLFEYRALDRLATGADRDWAAAAWCSLLKWSIALPLAGAAVWILVTLIARAVLHRVRVANAPPCEEPARVQHAHRLADGSERWADPDIIAAPVAPHASTAVREWSDPALPEAPPDSSRARWRTRAYQPPGREPASVGVCVSGGGIRSAAVTLGALQALREGGVLGRARYLVSVSGGGYMAGAFQLALTREQPRDPGAGGAPLARAGLATARDAFAPGSPEEDHIRRHAKYLADSPREKLLAAGVILRGLGVSLGLLGLAFVVAGVCLGGYYEAVPLTDLTRLRPRPGEAFPAFSPHARFLAPALALIGIAAAVSVVASLFRAHSGKSRPAWVRTTVRGFIALAAAMSLLTVVLPAVFWFFAWLSHRTDVLPDGPRGISILGALTAAATAVGGVFTALSGRVKKLKPSGEGAGPFAGSATSVMTRIGGGPLTTAVVWLVLLLLAFFGLALLSWSAVSAHGWPAAWRLGLPLALLLAAILVDQTTFSLHPFYRQRLAGAFAVRRAVLSDGSVGALPYDYNAESTRLSAYGKRAEGFPQVIFAASAAMSLRNRTAPGRPAVPFTFSHDWVGGPDTGWVRTATMEATAHPLIRRDLTVQSAVAVSGAAFASAMGSQGSSVQRLLALSNLRLGTWVPNPTYLAEVARHRPDWTMPRLPWVRRLRYQLQELAGRYSDTSPMVLCTDGGHFDNLGLVELLRLRCETVYVIDSSADSPPLATTLAEAVTLAYEDLGVRITFDQPEVLRLVPGSAAKVEPTEPMAALNTRFSADCVVRGVIEYPEPVAFPGRRKPSRFATLVFAKASLTPDMPYELLAYALKEKVFPRQSTFDQWFDHAQFDAYRALGHHLGAEAAKLPVKRRRFGPCGTPPGAPPRSG